MSLRGLCRLFLVLAAAAAVGLPTARASAQGDVDIVLEQFGLGMFYRPNDFTGVQVRVTSNLEEFTNVQVVWELPEGLGDIQEISRIVALGPGQPVSVWLYGKLLPTAQDTSVYTIRVYRDDDGDRGSELGAARIDPRSARRRHLGTCSEVTASSRPSAAPAVPDSRSIARRIPRGCSPPDTR